MDVNRQFGLRKPCSNCPFRSGSGSIELQKGRREGIIEDLLSGKMTTFPCHKTVYREDGRNHDEDGNYTPNDVAHCPGAAAVCRKAGRDSVVVQIASRMRFIDHDHYDAAKGESMEPEDLDIDWERVHLSPPKQ